VAQARRTKKTRAKANPKRASKRNLRPAITAFKNGFGFFIAGALTGVLSILFWQGYQSDAEGDMGSGLKAMITQSREQAAIRAAESVPPELVLVDNAPRIKPQYDFYTVLPEIEEVLPKDAPELPPVASVKTKTAVKPKTTPKSTSAKTASKLPPGSAYMLQVASYGQRADAERLKAKLALSGMRASIQKVSIESKNYFRVRIGPYLDYGSMTSDDYKLSQLGFKAMRLRISRAG
jgi:cell division protein FtsN